MRARLILCFNLLHYRTLSSDMIIIALCLWILHSIYKRVLHTHYRTLHTYVHIMIEIKSISE